MHEVFFIFIVCWILLGLRTTLYWLQSWQLREYRCDRMKAYLATKNGVKSLFRLWFFRGILPRPKLSGRIVLIGGLFGILSILFFIGAQYFIPLQGGVPLTIWLLLLILWERCIFLLVALSVFISSIPVTLQKQNIFRKAKKIIDGAQGVTVIGITGSFGKSSTKEILVHLLKSKFGEENILYTPENQNNEVAIARLVVREGEFFGKSNVKVRAANPSQSPLGKGRGDFQRFFVVEMGAYKKGEIKTVCEFVQPQIGILTGVNAQHLALFGSQKNVQKAKFELAEGTSEKVFFNAESALLTEVFADQEISATPVPLSLEAASEVKDDIDKTAFTIYGEKMVLPWPGKFYVMNALLSMETVRELGMTPKEITRSLPKLPPLKRALTMEKNKKGVVILKDIYSANPNGVLVAIAHLAKFPGRKIFVSIPLLELGEDAEGVHRQIFNELRSLGAEVFWWKKDFEDIGIEICGAHFYGKNMDLLKEVYAELEEGDVVLLESRLPRGILKMFEH